jgi:antitoxin ParD1/3/4
MNVSLTDELEKFVTEEVERGRYRSQSEVVRAGLRLLWDRRRSLEARLERLRGQVGEGLEEALRGELVDGKEVFDRILRRSSARDEVT